MAIEKETICCPSCGKKATWTPENSHRPFCSPRCKLIDLGEWASEQHRISGAPVVVEDNITTDDLDNEKGKDKS